MQGRSLHSVKACTQGLNCCLTQALASAMPSPACFTLHMKSLIIEPCNQALNIYQIFCHYLQTCELLVQCFNLPVSGVYFLGHADAHYAYKFAPEISTD
jgi:hypothetical protein